MVIRFMQRQTYDGCNRVAALLAIIVFSAAHNAFLLALPVYSLQVMGRVLPSGDVRTLCSLTLLLVITVTADWEIERSRAATLTRLASKLIANLQFEVSQRSEHLSEDFELFDLACNLKARLAGPLGLAILDAPWASIFLLALFYLKAELGFVAVIILASTFAIGAVISLAKRSRLTSSQSHGEHPSSPSGRQNCQDRTHVSSSKPLDAMAFTLSSADELYERSQTIFGVSQAARVVGQAALIAATAMLVAREELAVGSILASSMLFARAIAPVDRCSDVVAVGECFRLVLEVARRRRKLLALPIRARPTLPPLNGKVSLAGVGIRHPRTSGFILKDVTYEFLPGRLTLLAGQSGSGKSALLAVIAGSIKHDVGQIRIDGFAAADIDFEHRNRLSGRLDVQTRQTSGSIAQVIAGDKTIFLRSVVEAAQTVGLHEHIENLPDGYRTMVSPNDSMLSRGQEQQLSLARSFYGNPKLLLLDEPTTFLDEPGIIKLASALSRARAGGANIIVVSRCPKIVALHDDVICLAYGKVVGILTRKDVEHYVV